MLNKIIILLSVAVLSVQAGEKTNIAVLDFESRGSVTFNEVKIITERFQTELINSQRFSVLERSKVDKILEEQGFQKTGACSNSDCQVEMGQLLGVDHMIVGSIGKLGKLFTVNLKVIDVGTAEIITSYASDYTKGLEEVLVKGCKAMANSIKVVPDTATVATNATSTPSENTDEKETEVDSEGSSIGWWIAGGLVVAGTVVTYFILTNQNDKSSGSSQTTPIDLCKSEDPALCP